MSDNAEVKVITWEDVRTMSAPDMREKMKDPILAAQIEAAIAGKVPSETIVPEIKAVEPEVKPETEEEKTVREAEEKRVADEAAAAEAEQVRLAAEEQAKKDEEARKLEEAKKAEPEEIVLNYQATDEDGNPIGRPTYLRAKSWKEMVDKQKEVHIQATRAIERLKRQKLTLQKEEEVKPAPTEAELAAAAEDLDSKDPVKRLAAVRKITNQEEVEKERAATRLEENKRKGKEIANVFLANHKHDFKQCQANSKVLTDYLQENNLAFTADNLEIAFIATESQLAPLEVPVEKVTEQPKPEINPPVAVAEVPEVKPSPEPAAAVVPPPAAVNPNAVVKKPSIPADIQPGGQSGKKPDLKPAGLTKADIAKWSPDEMRKQMKDPKRKAEIDVVLAQPSRQRT